MYRKIGAPRVKFSRHFPGFSERLLVLVLSAKGLKSGLGHASWQTEIRNTQLTIILDNNSDDVMYSDAIA